MDGSISISYLNDNENIRNVNVNANIPDNNGEDDDQSKQLSTTKSNKTKDLVVIQDPNLAKKLAKYIAKKERKRKRKERFRQGPAALSRQLSSDSLGDMSKSTIENLYGTVAVTGTPRTNRSSISGCNSVDASKTASWSRGSKDDDSDDGDSESWDEPRHCVSRSNSSENDDLLQAAVDALEKYQLGFASSRSDSDEDIWEEMLQVGGEIGVDDKGDKHQTHNEETSGISYHSNGIVVDKAVVQQFVEDLGRGSKHEAIRKIDTTVTSPKKKQTKSKPQKIKEPKEDFIIENIKRQVNNVKPQSNRKSSIDVDGHHIKEVSSDLVKTSPPKEIDLIHQEDDCVSLDISLDLDIQDIEGQQQPTILDSKSKNRIDDGNNSISKRTSSETIPSRNLDEQNIAYNKSNSPFGSEENIDEDVAHGIIAQRQCHRLVSLSAIIVIVGSIALLIWMLTRIGVIDPDSKDEEVNPTLPPFQQLKSAGPTSVAYSFVSNTIETEFGEGSYSRLQDSLSPQAKAAFWIAEEDSFFSFPVPNDIVFRKAFRQRYAMAAFFYSTGGPDSWRNKFQFLSPGHVCAWTRSDGGLGGVFCIEDIVIGITLPSNGLDGSIPEEIWALDDLQVLELHQNSMEGSLPEDVSRLSGLRALSLSGNSLSGSLPASLGSLSSLKSLALSNCGLMGSLPNELANTDLERLYLDGNGFMGTVPTEYATLPLREWMMSIFLGFQPYLNSSL